MTRPQAHALIEATTAELYEVCAMVARGSLHGAAEIGRRVGKVLDKHKLAMHFDRFTLR